ncbi:MAG: DUF2341 domain-containing protein [Bacteroidales bacterium]|jgi:hypothetical protein
MIKNSSLEARRQKKTLLVNIILTCFLMVFMTGIISAWDWDNVKSYDVQTKTITITNALGLGSDIAKFTLLDNSNECLIDCYAIIKVDLREEENILNSITFKDKQDKIKEISNFNFYIQKEVIENVSTPKYKTNCKTDKNETCTLEKVGETITPLYKTIWISYNIKDKLPAGIYTLKIEGKKKLGDKVDWIVNAFGKDLTEWTWWDANWVNKKQLNITENSNKDIKQIQVPLNISYEANMKTDFGDLRFLNGAEAIELPYYLEAYNASSWAYVWVKVNLTASSVNSFYMYYNNPAASTTSSAANTFEYVEDFESYANNAIVSGTANFWSLDQWGNSMFTNKFVHQGSMAMNMSDQLANQVFIGKIGSSIQSMGFVKWFYYQYYITAGKQPTLYACTSNDGSCGTYAIANKDYPVIDQKWTTIQLQFNESDVFRYKFENGTAGAWTAFDSAGDVGDVAFANTKTGGDFGESTFDFIVKGNYTYPEPTYTFGTQEAGNTPSTITLNQPINNYNSSSASVIFNCSAVDDIGVKNLTMVINGTTQETQTGGVGQNLTIQRTETLGDGVHNWTCYSFDTAEGQTTTNLRNLTIDTIIPLISYDTGTSGNNTNFSRDWVYIDVAATETNFQNITYRISNSTNTTTYFNLTYISYNNFTSLIDGTYTYYVTIFDIVNHFNSTETRTINLDTITPTITLISPTNNTNSSDSGLDILYSAYDLNRKSCWYSNDTYLANVTLTGCANITSLLWNDGTHYFTIWVNDEIGNVNSTTGYFTIDTSVPLITINSGSGTETLGLTNHTISFTPTDASLSRCWLSYNSTNTTIGGCVSGVANTTTFDLAGTSYSALIWVNDTFGNINYSIVNWDYLIRENSQTYTSEVDEGSLNSFIINVSYDGTYYPNVVARLNYDGTDYVGTQTGSGSNTLFTRSINAPSVSATTNKTFYWNFELVHNSSLTNKANSTFNNQSVKNLAIDNCSVSSTALLNYYMKDELTQTNLNGSIETSIVILPTNSLTPLASYSVVHNGSMSPFGNSITICINNSLVGGNYLLGATTKYWAEGYNTEYNVIRYTNLNTTTLNQNITLLDLPTTSATIFKITYKDTSFLPVSSATIDISREYLSEGVFKTIERPITDFDGKTSASLIKDTGVYNFYVYHNNQLVANFLNVIPICQNPTITDCSIDLNSFSSSIPVNNFTIDNDFIFTLSNNRTGKISTLLFTIPSGAVSTIVFNVTKTDALGTNVCTNSLTSSAGTLTCTYGAGIGNETLRADIYKDGILVGSGHLSLELTPSQIYSGVLVILSIFVLLTLFGAAMSDNPVFTIVFFLIGIIVLFALNLVAHNGFIGAGATILWLVIAIILVIIKGSKRQ